MALIGSFFMAAWQLLEQSSLYILIGLLIGGLLKLFLSTDYVAAHLGQGRCLPVLKAALMGIPLPLCSCGVLPAAAQLKKQGANRGATTSFLIATPESGVDSIAASWALLDPLLTVARPISAFFTALVAGVLENLTPEPHSAHAGTGTTRSRLSLATFIPEPTCADGCCHSSHPHRSETMWHRVTTELLPAVLDIWADLVQWFFVGIVLAAFITVLLPDEVIAAHLGGGLGSMLLMLLAGIPLYICATASTPVAAALILKGVSPGTALVFLLAGPATNISALPVLLKIMGTRGVVMYLATIAICSVCCGLLLDALYLGLGISAMASVGTVAEVVPAWVLAGAAFLLLLLSLWTVSRSHSGSCCSAHS